MALSDRPMRGPARRHAANCRCPRRARLPWTSRAGGATYGGRAQSRFSPPSPDRPESLMTYVVTEACIKCKYMDCIEVCPVDCFYEGDNMLVSNPDECIDCGEC